MINRNNIPTYIYVPIQQIKQGNPKTVESRTYTDFTIINGYLPTLFFIKPTKQVSYLHR